MNVTVYLPLSPLQTHHPCQEKDTGRRLAVNLKALTIKGGLCLNFSQYSRDKCYETKVKRVGGKRVLPISTLRTPNSHPQPYVPICSLPKYVARHCGGTANVCKLP